MTVRYNNVLVYAAVLAACFLIVSRFYHLDADPDTTLSLSRVFYTDEGLNSCNAISNYLTGSWICDDHNHFLLMPVMSFVQYFVFSIFGMSLFTARLAVVFFSLLVVLIACAFIRDGEKDGQFGEKGGGVLLLALLLLATNFYYFNYSRLALLDLPMLGFGITSYYCAYKAFAGDGFVKKIAMYTVSGLLLAISFLTKPSAALFGCTLFAYALSNWYLEKRGWWRDMAGVIFIVTVAAVVVALSHARIAEAFKEYHHLVPGHLVSDRISLNPLLILQPAMLTGASPRLNNSMYSSRMSSGSMVPTVEW